MFTSQTSINSIQGEKKGIKNKKKAFYGSLFDVVMFFRLQSSNNKMKESEHIKKIDTRNIIEFQ